MSKHLKRLNTPRTVQVHRKERKWTIRASPGAHALSAALPLGLLIRDYLNLCDTRREAKRILSNGEVLVDGIIRKSPKFPVGFMDVITFPKTKKQYRIVYNRRGRLTLVDITTSEAEWKLRRIENKTSLRGNSTQLHFHDGANCIVKEDTYTTGDVVKFTFKDKKISSVYPRKQGSISLIIGGSHVGELATIDAIDIIASSKPNEVKMKGEIEFQTLERYVFPIGKNKPVISIPEVSVQ